MRLLRRGWVLDLLMVLGLVLAVGAGGWLATGHWGAAESVSIRQTSQVWEATVDGAAALAPILERIFTEPFETGVFIDRNFYFWLLTTHDDGRIMVTAGEWVEKMAAKGWRMGDMILFVHNHWIPLGPSMNDIITFRYFMSKGYKGRFLIYYPGAKAIREVRFD